MRLRKRSNEWSFERSLMAQKDDFTGAGSFATGSFCSFIFADWYNPISVLVCGKHQMGKGAHAGMEMGLCKMSIPLGRKYSASNYKTQSLHLLQLTLLTLVPTMNLLEQQVQVTQT